MDANRFISDLLLNCEDEFPDYVSELEPWQWVDALAEGMGYTVDRRWLYGQSYKVSGDEIILEEQDSDTQHLIFVVDLALDEMLDEDYSETVTELAAYILNYYMNGDITGFDLSCVKSVNDKNSKQIESQVKQAIQSIMTSLSVKC